jgi:hypothetical protein
MSRAIHPIISLLALVAWSRHAADHMPDARASMNLPLHVLAVEEMPPRAGGCLGRCMGP